MEAAARPPKRAKESDFLDPIPERKRRYRFARSLATRINGRDFNTPNPS
jgi:hypothetical protein